MSAPTSTAPAAAAETTQHLDGLSLGELRRLAVAKGWSTATRADKAGLLKILREHPDGPPAQVAARSGAAISAPAPVEPTTAAAADQPEQTPGAYLTEAEEDDDFAAAPTASPLYAAYLAGEVKLFKLRANGTARRVPHLTGEALEHAEYLRLRRDEGASIRQIAEETGLSRSTVRRALWTLVLIDAMADGELDDLYEAGDTELCLGGLGEDEASDEQAEEDA